MRRLSPKQLSSLLALLALATGCGGPAHPRAVRPRAETGARNVARAQADHEYPSSTSPHETVGGSVGDPVQAIWAFATTYINWTSQTVADHMRALAAGSVGQARSAMTLAAAQTAQDYELMRGGISNSGKVEAIAPLLGHRGEYVVVTRERTTATDTTAYQGLRPAWHVTIATVLRLAPGQWVLSGWQPEG